MVSINLGFIIAAKGTNGIERPRFGRCWWYWRPRIKWNHGIPWRDVCCDIGITWLCFSPYVIIWSNIPSPRKRRCIEEADDE